MNWDRIESKWAAMSRRLRPDLPAPTAFVADALKPSVGEVSIPGDEPERGAELASADARQIG